MKKVGGPCRACGQERPLTEEHIILQAIGGPLKAALLCKPCNEGTGHEIDAFLAKQLEYFSSLLQVRRDRGKHPAVRITQVESGEEYEIKNQTAYIARPKMTTWQKGKVRYAAIHARSEKEYRKMLNGFIRKHKLRKVVGFDMPQPKKPLGEAESIVRMGSRPGMRAVAKMAHLFLASRLPATKVMGSEFDAVRRFVFHDEGEALTAFNYVDTAGMVDMAERPIHSIYVHFDTRGRNVVGFVQLFGVWRFSVLLARSWSSQVEVYDMGYAVDPRTSHEPAIPLTMKLADVSSKAVIRPRQRKALATREMNKGLERALRHIPGTYGRPSFEHVE